MAQSLRIDLDALRALSPELARIAEDARRDLSELETSLAGEGRCWGDDEPGRMFGETYEPELDDGLTSFRTVIENLGRISAGTDRAAGAFEQQDLDGARRIMETPRPETITRSPVVPGSLPVDRTPVPANAVPDPLATAPPGTTVTPATVTTPDPSAWQPGTPPVGSPAFPDSTGASAPTGGNPTGSDPGPSDANTVPGTSDATTPAVGSPPATTPNPGARPDTATSARPAAPSNPTPARAAPETPWSRAPGATGADRPATPWKRDGIPVGAPRGQVFSPTGGSPPPPPARQQPAAQRPGTPQPGAKKRERKKDKPVAARPGAESTGTDPAALEAARALARRHGLRLTGFESSGIDPHSVAEIAAALDDLLARYPFLALGGLEVAELRSGLTAVRWERPADGQPTARIVLQRRAFAEPGIIAEKLRAAALSARIAPGSGERPGYAVIVHALARIMADTAGAPVRRWAEQALITEYHRISGPWTHGDTLASVVRGYRDWREQLSGACFRRGRLAPGAALIDGFAEVELLGDRACGPAKVLHRLVVENARGRSDP
ncbi:hypothetical protein [Nocardia sp. NPDC024068]|uniref:hypothetical protein n=1 Tax=Nocardia sp. NPDC024068 TaxID=3157197 RepID=UPI0033F52B78